MELTLGFTAYDIIEEGRVSRRDIDLIKDWISTEQIPELTDEQIVTFLISCNCQQELTQSVIQNYCAIRNSAPAVFSDRCIKHEAIQTMLKLVYYTILPKRTIDNYAIIIFKLRDTDTRNFNFEAHLKLICMLLDAVSYTNPPDGLISLLDLEGISFSHVAHVKLYLIPIFTRYVQVAMPLQLKAVHLFNGGVVLKVLFNLFKPFINREVRENIHFHTRGANMDLFYANWIAKECLPMEYGGNLEPLIVHQENIVSKLTLMQPFFDAEEEQRRDFRSN